jgi:micrococcal nuclease
MKHILFLLLLLPSLVLSQTITGKVVKIADGDTFTLLVNNEQIRIRLHGIDAPEKAQPFSQVATDFLSEMVFGKMVSVRTMDVDRYGRTIGMVSVDGVNVNEALLRAGLVWHYKYYDKNQEWARMESEARSAKLGLWSQPNPIPPWEYRRK